MSDEIGDELQEIASDFDSQINESNTSSDTSEQKSEDEQLSKEEIADDFEVQFAKKPGNSVQHLVRPEEDDTLCGVGLGSDVKRIDNPGPFDPICQTCRYTIEGGATSGQQTYDDLRRWLADEVEGVSKPKSTDSSHQLRKDEAAAIVEHIHSLKNEDQ